MAARSRKAYNHPKSPADRFLEHPGVNEKLKLAIRTMSQSLDPLYLYTKVD